MSDQMQSKAQVFLYDGEDRAGNTLERANQRLSWFQNGAGDNIIHGLHTDGNPCKSCEAIIRSIKALYDFRIPSLIFVHSSACSLEYLANDIERWNGLPSSNVVMVLYSGTGVSPVLEKPVRREAVAGKLAYIGRFEKGIDSQINAGDVVSLIDYFHRNAHQLCGPSREGFLTGLCRIIKQINHPFRGQSIALHTALSVYLAAQGVDPRGRIGLVCDVWADKSALIQMLNRLRDSCNWKPFLAVPPKDVGNRLEYEGANLCKEIQEFCAFLGSEISMPNNDDLVIVWGELDMVVRR